MESPCNVLKGFSAPQREALDMLGALHPSLVHGGPGPASAKAGRAISSARRPRSRSISASAWKVGTRSEKR